MEVIQDELKQNDIRIDIETIAEHIECIFRNYKDSFNEAAEKLTRSRRSDREEILLDVFHEMNINNFGRAMSYLTLVYRMSHIFKEDEVRQAVRLAVPVIRNTARIEGGFIRELCSWGRSLALNLWDLM